MNPRVGIIFRRDAHPGAGALADLLDVERLGRIACDEHLPLSEALEREWEEDAHLILYRLDGDEGGNEWTFARANKRSPLLAELRRAGGDVRVFVLALDHDLPDKAEWASGQVDTFLAGLASARDLPEPTAWYQTLHGSRFVWVLSTPVTPERAEGLIGVLSARLAAVGVPADSRARDWTRLFRLPRTRREDTGEQYRGLLLTGGPALDPNTLPADEVPQGAVAELVPYEGDRPDADEVRTLLGHGGKQTDLVRAAKQYLRGRDAYRLCFEHGRIDTSRGWNNGVLAAVGQVVSMLARHEASSPEGCYALLYDAVEQLQAEEDRGHRQEDWFERAWDMVCRMWTCEQAAIEAEHAQRAAAAAEGKELQDELVEQRRAARPQDVPEDREEAREWLRRQAIASTGRWHHVMRRDGTYNVEAVTDSMIVPMIRDLGMDDVIEVYEMRGRTYVRKSAQSILNDCAVPVTSVRCSSRDKEAYIDGEAGERTLHIPVHRLNPKVRPEFSLAVDEWLRALASDHYDRLAEWLAHAPEVGSPICALNLYGASGAGKGMLAQGLVELFAGEHVNDQKVISTQFNLGLLKSPLVWCDEGLPALNVAGTNSTDQAFRQLVTGGNLSLVGKGDNPISADVYPRLVITSQNEDVVRSIVGRRDLSDEDVKAIEVRMLSICAQPSGRVLLTARGNYAYTRGWIGGDVPSRYVLANHIMHLHAHRKPSRRGSGRLLVEGETRASLLREVRLQSPSALTVLRALVRMLESPQGRPGLVLAENKVWVTASAVVDYCDSALVSSEKISLISAGRVLKQFSRYVECHDGRLPKVQPPGARRGRWIELDLATLCEEALRYGMDVGRVQQLLREQEGGGERLEKVYQYLEATE